MSFSNEQAAIAGEARISKQHAVFREQLMSFVDFMDRDASEKERRARFHEVLGQSADFANICEQSIGDASLLGATRNEAWAKNKAETSLNALDTILQAHLTIVVLGSTLGVPPESFRPSPTAYASIQRHVAIFFPQRVDAMRAQFENSGLPVVGFDEELPPSAARKAVRALLAELRPIFRDARERANKRANQLVETNVFSGQLVQLDAEGGRLIADHANWLCERWARCAQHLQPTLHTRPRVPVQVSAADAADELEERISILELLDVEIVKSEANLASEQGEFFHVLASFDRGEPAIANDLSREMLTTTITGPLLAGKAIRVDGHLVEPDHPRLKLSRTARDAAHFRRELQLRQKRTGSFDVSVNPRQLPIDLGTDVTAQFLGSLKPKKNKNTSGDPMERTHNTIVWLVFVLGLAAIGAGVVALVSSATGTTKLKLVGIGLDTSSVGVACIAIGLLIAWLAIRSVLRSMKDLAQIRANTSASRKQPKRRTP